MCPRLEESVVKEIVTSAVNVECLFVKETLPNNLKGMNRSMMQDYVKFVADHLVTSLNYKPIYNKKTHSHLWKQSPSKERPTFLSAEYPNIPWQM